MIPRCVVRPEGIDVITDQLTSPYTRGSLNVEYDDKVVAFNSEYRRMPLKMSINLKYYADTFTDSLSVAQQIVSKLMFIQTFNISYLGQSIRCSYKVPESISPEKNIEFDGGTTDQKARTIELELELEANFPVYDGSTAIEDDLLISGMRGELIIAKKDRVELKI